MSENESSQKEASHHDNSQEEHIDEDKKPEMDFIDKEDDIAEPRPLVAEESDTKKNLDDSNDLFGGDTKKIKKSTVTKEEQKIDEKMKEENKTKKRKSQEDDEYKIENDIKKKKEENSKVKSEPEKPKPKSKKAPAKKKDGEIKEDKKNTKKKKDAPDPNQGSLLAFAKPNVKMGAESDPEDDLDYKGNVKDFIADECDEGDGSEDEAAEEGLDEVIASLGARSRRITRPPQAMEVGGTESDIERMEGIGGGGGGCDHCVRCCTEPRPKLQRVYTLTIVVKFKKKNGKAPPDETEYFTRTAKDPGVDFDKIKDEARISMMNLYPDFDRIGIPKWHIDYQLDPDQGNSRDILEGKSLPK